MPRSGCGGDLHVGDIQGRDQGPDAVANVVVAAPLDQVGLYGLDRLRAFRRLDLGLYLYAQHNRVFCRSQKQVEAADAGGLADPFRIGGEPKRLGTPRRGRRRRRDPQSCSK